MGNGEKTHKCGFAELVIFLAAIITGTACSICSKTMMQLHSIGMDGNVEEFSKPIFQTFGMFVGMLFGLVMHWFVLVFKIPFPGYEHHNEEEPKVEMISPSSSKPKYGAVDNETSPLVSQTSKPMNARTPLWMYFFLAIPSVFDLAATALCMMGLRYLDVSIYQLLRGSGIIFVALMKQHVLGDHLYKFQWFGVFWNVVSVILVGTTAILNSGDNSQNVEPGDALLGIVLVMLGAFVQALQFVFEEKVMTMDEVAVPPLLLIGMEGLWGSIICLFVVYPLAYYLPGNDHGSYEDPWNTYMLFMNSRTIQISFIIYFFAIFGYNLFAVLVTFMLNSIWHAILDNFRPITVWLTDLMIFYVISQVDGFGEPWTKYSIIQLFGMCVLLYGTAVYNAPNAGSIKLKGEWFSFCVDLSDEYEEIELSEQEAQVDAEWDAKVVMFQKRRASSLAERSPHISIHTQALRGLASPKI